MSSFFIGEDEYGTPTLEQHEDILDLIKQFFRDMEIEHPRDIETITEPEDFHDLLLNIIDVFEVIESE